MKKLMIAVLSAIMFLFVSGCGNNDGEESASTVTQYDLNEPIAVQTEYGDYKVTITGAEIKDWRELSNGSIKNLVVALNYTVENINFSNANYAGCYIGNEAFYVYDDSKTLLNNTSIMYDGTFPNVVLPGCKSNFNLCYELNGDTPDYLNVVLHRNDNEILGQITIELEQQAVTPVSETNIPIDTAEQDAQSNNMFELVKQEVYGENYGKIETQFTIKNISNETVIPTINIGEYDLDGNLLSTQGRTIHSNIAPGEQATIKAFHKMDFELIQQVKIVSFGYTDANKRYSEYDVNDMPFMKIYENWTHDEQLKNQ